MANNEPIITNGSHPVSAFDHLPSFYRLEYDFEKNDQRDYVSDCDHVDSTNNKNDGDNVNTCCLRRRWKGRHLRANRSAHAGELLWLERPLLTLSTLGMNRQTSWTCSYCHAFVGGPYAALRHRFSSTSSENDPSDIAQNTNIDDKTSANNNPDYQVYPCPHQCGHVYCSSTCQAMAWKLCHSYLCTGLCDTNDTPLIEFITFAIKTNEILLLVAEWWITQHVVAHHHQQQQQQSPTQHNPYTDFQMNAWWDVVMHDVPLDEPGSFATAIAITHSLRTICSKASDLLNQLFASINQKNEAQYIQNAEHNGCRSVVIPVITDVDIAKRIGCCEQNIMGIRQRHPLCRDIFDRQLREDCHKEIVQCLMEANFIGVGNKCSNEACDASDVGSGSDDDDNEDEDEDEATTSPRDDDSQNDEINISVDEVAGHLASLFVDEDGTVLDVSPEAPKGQRSAEVGDDYDAIFPPLDGTAMFANICKMNHSCAPNVILLFRSSGWGRCYPLTAHCVALRDIGENDELTISYIDKHLPYHERQKALSVYGFQCECEQCVLDVAAEELKCVVSSNHELTKVIDSSSCSENEGMVVESDKAAKAEYEPLNDDKNILVSCCDRHSYGHDHQSTEEERLQNLFCRLETVTNHRRIGTLPRQVQALASTFVSQTVATMMSEAEKINEPNVSLLRQCVHALAVPDYSLCSIVGTDLLELLLQTVSEKNHQWTNPLHQYACWCASITAAIGYSHVGRFVPALEVLKNAASYDLPRDDCRIRPLVAAIEHHAGSMMIGGISLIQFHSAAQSVVNHIEQAD
jgi:hypothetical protein